MDQICEELIAVLKSHSERDKQFIVRLKNMKSSDTMFTKVWNALPSIRSSKQPEVMSVADTPQTEQSEENTIHEIIQDITKKLEIVEEETEQVVKRLSLHYELAKPKKVEVIQVYGRDVNTSEFLKAFQERLDSKYELDVIEDVSKIDVNKPLLVLCQARSRLIPDIEYSLELFKEVGNVTRLGIVIIHSKEEHALPTTSSQVKVNEDKRFKDAWIIDTAFTNARKFYDCKMNNEAIVKLQKFLKSETSV